MSYCEIEVEAELEGWGDTQPPDDLIGWPSSVCMVAGDSAPASFTDHTIGQKRTRGSIPSELSILKFPYKYSLETKG
jgi:hypothetical protein